MYLEAHKSILHLAFKVDVSSNSDVNMFFAGNS